MRNKDGVVKKGKTRRERCAALETIFCVVLFFLWYIYLIHPYFFLFFSFFCYMYKGKLDNSPYILYMNDDMIYPYDDFGKRAKL